MAQCVVGRVLRFHHLFAGKSKWEIREDNEVRDKHHLYVGLWRFLYNDYFHYFPEGVMSEETTKAKQGIGEMVTV